MTHKIELLAPGGDIKAIKAAIVAGADAVYCGLNKFNARNRAANISFEDLQGIIRMAHHHDCEIFLTLNIVIVDSETPALFKLLNRLTNTKIDGVIIQDFGLFHLLNTYFPRLKIHASTQLTTHNEGQLQFLKHLNAERVNLSRELSIAEIKDLTLVAHQHDVLTEVFVHGSYCISFSGLCYMSSLHGGNSGNRGRCSQPCRDKYQTTEAGLDYPLNLKDNSAFENIEELVEAGVDSLKIEGRIKEAEYVYTTVNAWRKQIDTFVTKGEISLDKTALYTVFNRDFSNGFLKGSIAKEMFIDNPMSHSTTYFSQQLGHNNKGKSPEVLYEDKNQLRLQIADKTKGLKTDKLPLKITVSGISGDKLKLKIVSQKNSFEIISQSPLSDDGTEALSLSILKKRLVAIEETEYELESVDWQIDTTVYIPFRELTAIKKQLLYVLCNDQEYISPVKTPKLKHKRTKIDSPKLSVLINEVKQAKELNGTDTTIHFQLPNSLGKRIDYWLDIFTSHPNFIPWFPSILIGDDYAQAVAFLKKLNPKEIVTNNTGIAFEANKLNIKWIAGPQLNLTNSYALLTLKKEFNCSGAFISNEISQEQMRTLKSPEDFDLYYSIYHPIELMTSRQCFFHQVTTCNKHKIDDTCISSCHKTATITNLKDQRYIIEKSPNSYHRIYNEHPLLNTKIAADMKGRISSYMVDLRSVEGISSSILPQDISTLKDYVIGDGQATQKWDNRFPNGTNTQYEKGI